MALYPELRLQQIMTIAARKSGWLNEDLFYCPDETITRGLEIILSETNNHN